MSAVVGSAAAPPPHFIARAALIAQGFGTSCIQRFPGKPHPAPCDTLGNGGSAVVDGCSIQPFWPPTA